MQLILRVILIILIALVVVGAAGYVSWGLAMSKAYDRAAAASYEDGSRVFDRFDEYYEQLVDRLEDRDNTILRRIATGPGGEGQFQWARHYVAQHIEINWDAPESSVEQVVVALNFRRIRDAKGAYILIEIGPGHLSEDAARQIGEALIGDGVRVACKLNPLLPTTWEGLEDVQSERRSRRGSKQGG